MLPAAVLAAICLISCNPDDGPDGPDAPPTDVSLNVTTRYIDFDQTADTASITIRSNGEWTFETDAEWILGRKENDNTLIITVTENREEHSREGSLDIVASPSLRHTITVVQLGWGKEIVLSAKSAEVDAAGGVVEVEVTTNIEFGTASDSEWVRRAADVRSREVKTSTVQLLVDGYTGSVARMATVTFSDSDGSDEFAPQTFTIRQSPLGDYNTPDPSVEVKDDVAVKPTGYSAPEGVKGYDISQAFDGRPGTCYRTANALAESDFPAEIRCDFAGEQLDCFVYTPSSDVSGRWQRVDIEVLTDANARAADEWQQVVSLDFAATPLATKVDFPTSLIGVKALKFKIHATADMRVSVADLAFYRRNPDNFDWSTLFTDRSCSELRAGITEADINSCRHSLYRSIAFYLYHGRYPEFRAAAYRACQHPDVQARQLECFPYSLLDNVTGIAVKKSEELVVLAELNGRTDVKLCTVDYDREEIRAGTSNWTQGDGIATGRREYALASGVNSLTMQSDGLLYVMYHTDDYATAPEVKIHFAAGGTVNGYYDKQNPSHAGRWRELLAGAKYKYFDVRGEFSQLCYETRFYRDQCSDMHQLIDLYDRIAYRQDIFFGLMRDRNADMARRNRLMFINCYWYGTGTGMYAWDYHVAVNQNMTGGICDNASMSRGGGACSPLAHEAGHMHQIGWRYSKGFSTIWDGVSEVTNNNMTSYIVNTVFGNVSTYGVAFASGWNNIIAKQAAHSAGSGSEKLAPMWQLELYFGNVLGQTPRLGDFAADTATDPSTLSDEEYAARYDGFYPRFYQYALADDTTGSNLSQAMYALHASRAAGMDLTEFFEKWGFFKGLSITSQQADDVRGRIASLGLPGPTDAIEYITNDNFGLYKKRAAMTVGTASLSGKKLIISGCSNVVAYEVLDSEGKLRYAAEGSAATVDAADWDDGWRLCAVQYDGQRTEIKVNNK